ncbi:hypothetical protein GOM49_06970 [Clostridium bovifaecis]|uniref:Uncharacterized protein n=1 Tax=Clostridium bovifaecis TaxID=2184719 RepID=A0A6I6EVC7_9CLOT|nr:hypothetical protein GOM49_06970 [Clostridium bovifaecis]
MNNLEDNKINEILLMGTDEVTELKEQVWSNIESKLNMDEDELVNIKTKKNNLFTFFKYGSLAAAISIVIMANTEYGHATANKIRQLFEPNKIVSEEIEGMNEKSNVLLKEGSSQYIIYIDEERYTMQNLNGKDIITPKVKAEGYPNVSMEIYQVKNKRPEIVASEIEKSLKGKYTKVNNMEKVKNPIDSIFIYANSGSNWNDVVEKYYFIDNTKGGTFIVKQQLFFEASEGHGVRFDNMIKEFKIVN